MSAIADCLARWKWHYVGTAFGQTDLTESGQKTGTYYRQYWVLTERADGRRRCKSIGTEGHSACQIKRHAQVSAWLRGGPLPPLEQEFMNGQPPRGQLVMFNGGKGDAA